jgi:formamidopyrimidine-DNA glycosylase
VRLVKTDELDAFFKKEKLGPEPLKKDFTLDEFSAILKRKPKEKIKQFLIDQRNISGIGNIYSDEILWYAGAHPLKRVEKLNDKEVAAIYKYIRFVLKKAVGVLGDSEQDYRTLEGKMGGYQNKKKAYQLTGEKCQKHDGGIIKRIKINGRSAHFCPVHQKL